jgi:acetyltransferase-like isoleucine patch superfamily enzyme
VPVTYYVRLAGRVAIVKSTWYSARFHGLVLVGRGSRLRVHRPARVSLERGAVLLVGLEHERPSGASIVLHPKAELHVNGVVQIMRDSHVTVHWGGRLTVAGGTYFNDGTLVYCAEEITIGADCAIAWNVTITDTDVHRLLRSGAEHTPSRPISLGDGCWIGTGATLLKGACVGSGAVVGARSLVLGDVAPHTLVGGVPARQIADDISWTLR